MILRVSFLFLFSGLAAFGTERTIQIKNAAQLAEAAPLLAQPAEKQGERLILRIASGDYLLFEALRIQRSEVALLAEPGARFRLASGVNQPVIAIGSQREIPGEKERIGRVRIRGLVIDGNRRGQSSELGRTQPWIRNNGIDVRMVSDLEIDNVRVTGCRSGGLVISWKCANVRVTDSMFLDNFFDGVAYYDSRRIETTRCAMARNRGAGVSADNHFSVSRFIDCRILENRDVGIFMRASRDILFDRCEIAGSGSWAAFLAHNESGDGVHDVRFRNCRFRVNNGGVRMASINDRQSSGNRVERGFFQGNGANGRADLDSAGALLKATGNREE